MNDREKLIQRLIEEKGGSRKDYLNLLDSIAYHESAHTLDPTIRQQGGGPGRGKYQFEEGINQGGITAAKRTKQYYSDNNIPVPQWLDKATTSNSLDATNLTSEQQDVLFLGNMRKHPKADFSKVWDGKETVSDFWANYHWAGAAKDRPKRLKSFNSSMEDFKTYTPPTKKVVNNYKSSTVPAPTMETLTGDIKKLSMGGSINNKNFDQSVNSFNTGGLHEENVHEGIPLGMGENGKLNTVEQGESSFNFDDGKYIFSNRLGMEGLLQDIKKQIS